MTEMEKLRRENEELRQRLQAAFQADEAMQHFRAAELKGKIARNLKIAKEDYEVLRNREATPEYYGAMVDILGDIFSTLNRLGVEI